MPAVEFGLEYEPFRKEVAEFFKAESRPEWFALDAESEDYRALGRAMDKKLIERGWYTLHWPKKYGGGDSSPVQQSILRELTGYFRVPSSAGHGRYIIGPALTLFGTEDQKLRYLPQISRGELVICLGFTEANSGSDLASLMTSAVEDGDHYVVNGSKLYITYGTFANAMFLAARTDLKAPRYKNMSLFLLDMNLPGVTIRPFDAFSGARIAEVFFDNVRVPKEALLGEQNKGFYHMATALNFERAGVDRPALYMAHLEELADYCRENGLWQRPRVRQTIGRLASQIQAWRAVCWRVVQLQTQGKLPTWEASMSQFYRKEINPQYGQAILEILGPRALLEQGDPEAILYGRSEKYLREAFDNHGQGGRFVTRNVIARRALDMPK